MSESLEYDVIVAGGGTVGCVIAGRLAAADPNLKILVIESGPPVRENQEHIIPAKFLSHLLPTSTTVKFHVGKPSEELAGRTPIVPAGACLGGGSSVNFMMYTRASASDYDDWEKLYSNPGWGSADLLQYLKKAETNQALPNKPTHGYEGPLKVSFGGIYADAGKQFLEIAEQFDKDRPVVDDMNDLSNSNAYARWAKWIDCKTGRRQDVPHNYIYNQIDTTGLDVRTGYTVKRILFDGTRATGVEFVPNARYNPDEDKTPRIAKARKLVVLSAGTFGTPSVLERSGVGAEKRLSALGVKTVSDLPGVGENYQDHPIVFSQYFVDDNADTLDGLIQGRPEELQKWGAQYMTDGTGLLAHNAVEAGGKLRPSPQDLDAFGPDFRKRWDEFYAKYPDKPVLFIACSAGFVGNPMGVPPRRYSTIAYAIWYSSAVGYLHITDANDVDAPLDFDPITINGKEDIAAMRWAYKHGRELARRMGLHRGEFDGGHPAYPEGSAAAVRPSAEPTPLDTPKLVYTAEDDAAIDLFNRQQVGTMWHSLGTCAMKPRAQGGVVDSKLNVYGVTGLKVADMSIAPSNVGANTYSTALTIGEKAAAIIGEELGLTI
ncbi:hypothetical protein POSPLADRAFT_1169270 [Postia placenta MAD-698-R-SB12]|uniref:Glucose-methanol-choline oxidoreductase N-terminal domain-containing protein n=1 Tax=Postia placenta MAD-698-R-SB12 TaxID=670580 RepID=A0A1X6N1T9_9APHY|nr:hypothetical protein POSPLADRAFT_1169270 [Postia placenta MAD-698-R-SB12]OSX62585.1 hypothetical protein POSPLADRAFT_1169270 [Postia placenta MAD-698-R-SB12]